MTLSATDAMKWQALLSMTSRMQALSGQAEWEALVELAAERQTALEDFFASADLAGHADEIHQGIQHILDADRQLLGLSRQTLADIGDALHGLSTSRKAVQQYENCRR